MALFSKIAMYVMSAFFTYAGVSHFRNPKFFLKIMPPFIPAHEFMVAASGVAEIVLGLGLLFPQTRAWAAWGIIALLIVVFPANIYMAYADKFQALSPWIRWGRLPIQGLLIWWAYQYTK